MLRLAALALVIAACGKGSDTRDHAPGEPVREPAPVAKDAPACAKGEQKGPITWIEDDYAAAIACAKSRNVPVVLDLWAPWCHTCLSMQSTVFMETSFAAKTKGFVFAALDTDKPENEAPVGKFPLSAWPTFYVISPDEAVLARFVGSASADQFHAFLDAGAAAHEGGPAGADAHLLAAERAAAAKDHATADKELTAALAAAPPAWPRRPDALVSLMAAKRKLNDIEGCLALAEQKMNETGSSASASDFNYLAMDCVEASLADGGAQDPAKAARAKALRDRAITRWTALVDDAKAPLSVDDRSDALANLRETLIAVGRPDEAKAIAERQLALLDEAAAAAPTPTARMTYIWPRSEVYVHLGRPLDLVPSLEALAKELPTEYDPPARIGWLYWKAGKLPEAARWTDQALTMVYGPRKARLLVQRAEIAKAAGDAATEKKFRADVVALYESLPPGQANPAELDKAKATLAALDAPPAAKQ